MPEEKEVNFFCFLHWLVNIDDFHTNNEHWLPQFKFLRSAEVEVEYSFIGKFENLAEDASTLLRLMGCGIDFPSQEKVRFAPTNATNKLKKYFTKREVNLVETHYKSDFIYFNYANFI